MNSKAIKNGLFICSLFLCSCSATLKKVPAKSSSRITTETKIPSIKDKRQKELEIEIESWLGTPYRYGGSSKRGTDCSGFIVQIYQKVYKKTLIHSAQGMLLHNCERITKDDLKIGDLVFFLNNNRKNTITNHVGIYLGENNFAHATTNHGVIISNLNESYYKDAFVTAARVK